MTPKHHHEGQTIVFNLVHVERMAKTESFFITTCQTWSEKSR